MGTEDQQTANEVATVSVKVGAAAAAGCRGRGSANNEVKVERRQNGLQGQRTGVEHSRSGGSRRHQEQRTNKR